MCILFALANCSPSESRLRLGYPTRPGGACDMTEPSFGASMASDYQYGYRLNA